jgi:hypothetical protein
MNDHTKQPICVVAPGPHSLQTKYVVSMYQDYLRFDDIEDAWEFAVISQRIIPGSTAVPSSYKSAFSFVCIQE